MRSLTVKDRRRRLSVATVSLCFLAQAAIIVNAQGTPESEPRYQELPNFHQVNTKVYRGGQPRQGGIQKLATLGVKTIINLRNDDERAEAEGREAGAAGLRYFNIPLGRLGRPQDAEVERVLSLINDPQNGVIFVHCAHGADRTGVIMAVYRITHDGWTSEQAKHEADRYGMKFWQRGMKDYIHDYYHHRATPANPVQPERGRKFSSSLFTPTPSFPRLHA
jgi:tyrosine-protein phosphatase SIW14